MAIPPHPSRWPALLLCAALLSGAAACADGTDENVSATTTSSPATAGALDKAAACGELTKDLDVLKMRALKVMDELIQAENDPSLAPKAVEDVHELFTEMQTAADKHLATTGDPELKAALTAFSQQIKVQQTTMAEAGQDIGKLFESMDDPAFEEAGNKVDQLCP